MRRRPPRRPHEDSGAALILAIGFVVMVGAISAGLASLTTSSLNNRVTLEMVRDREYAADGAIEQAIAQVRTEAGSPLTACASAGGSIVAEPLNGMTIVVDWRNACGAVRGSDGTVVAQRNVIFSACAQTTGVTSCSLEPIIIRAQVNFQQSAGAVTKTYVQSWSVNG